MGCTAACNTCKRSEDPDELSNKITDKVKPPPVVSPYQSVDYIRGFSNANSKLLSSTSLVKMGTFNLSLNKSRFISERKSKITDYYEMMDVIGEGTNILRRLWQS
jgi:hypothetical protein